VTAAANTPTYFARVIGKDSFLVGATSEATSRDLDMILVLDTSGSMADRDPSDPLNRRAIDLLGPSAMNFIDRFTKEAGGDRIGVITFASGAVVSVPINKTADRGFDKDAMRNLICTNRSGACVNNLSASGSTASGEAMRRALTELNQVPSSLRSSLRIIVFFSDGAPNDVAGSFNSGSVIGDLYSEALNDCNESNRATRVYRIDSRDEYRNDYNIATLPPSMDYSTILQVPYVNETQYVNLSSDTNSRNLPNFTNSRCNVNRAARNMVENVANTARSGTGNNAVTIHALGLGLRLRTLEAPLCGGYGSNEWGESILKRVANATDANPRNASQPTGSYIYAQNATELDNAFQTIANQILRLSK
jgi:uncharacterized protein YegL